MSNFVIRSLAHHDLPAISQIANESFTQPWKESDFQFFLEHPSGFCQGYFKDDALVAYFFGLMVQGEMDVITLATHQNYRRQGLMESLLLSILESPELENLTLEVDVRNTQAISLYQKLGLKVAGVRKKYYEGLWDAYRMVLKE